MRHESVGNTRQIMQIDAHRGGLNIESKSESKNRCQPASSLYIHTHTHTHYTYIGIPYTTTIFSKRIAVWYFNCLRLVDNAQSQPKRINLLISHEAAQRQQQQQQHEQQRQRLEMKYEIRDTPCRYYIETNITHKSVNRAQRLDQSTPRAQ